MITLLAWILLIINLAILVISLIVLFMHPKKEAKQPSGSARSFNLPYIPDPWEESKDTDNERKRILEHIQLRYPEFKVMFEELSTDHACIFRFKGITKKEDHILYVLRNKDAAESFLASCEQFTENAGTPMYGILIAIPFNHTCNDEILLQIRTHGLSLHMIMEDDSCMNDLFCSQGKEAYVSIGRKPYAIFEVRNDNEEYDWLGELDSYQLFHPVYTKNADLAVHAIADLLPPTVQFYLTFPSLFSKKIMEECMEQFPETIGWFLPVIDKQDQHLVLYAPSPSALSDAIKVLDASAKARNVSLNQIEIYNKQNILSHEEKDYDTWMHIIQTSVHPDAIIPVLREDHHRYECRCPVVSFAPLFQNQKTSSSLAILYYKQLLSFKNQS